MRFPKPPFEALLEHYKTDPESVHDCPRLYSKPISINTCAIRITEALVLANRLVKSRVAISQLTSRGGDGKGFLLGKYGYKANLCPHGIARGAADTAYFLQEQWGRATYTWPTQEWVPYEIMDQTGVISFIQIPGYSGQGHMDVWNKTECVGSAYWNSKKIMFWKLT